MIATIMLLFTVLCVIGGFYCAKKTLEKKDIKQNEIINQKEIEKKYEINFNNSYNTKKTLINSIKLYLFISVLVLFICVILKIGTYLNGDEFDFMFIYPIIQIIVTITLIITVPITYFYERHIEN
jgi:multidrug efflux pump subunit AcrB